MDAMRTSSSLTDDDIFGGDRFLQWFTNLGLSEARQRRNLAALIVLPSLLPIFAATFDQRLYLMSVSDQTAHGSLRPGMSLFGDTMVWPFFFLVPLSLILLRRAATAVRRMSNDVNALATTGNVTEQAQKAIVRAHSDFINKLRKTLRGKRGWLWGMRTAYGVGLLVWAYNFTVCTFSIDDLPPHLYAVERFLTPYGDIPKWDTDRERAFASWLAARVWALFAYGLASVALVKACHLVRIVVLYAWWLRDTDILTFRPLSRWHGDELAAVSRASLAATYLIIPLALMAFVATFKEAIPPGPQNQILMFVLTPVAVLVFTLPMLSVHGALRQAKDKYLTEISRKYDTLGQKVFTWSSASDTPTREFERVALQLETLGKLYDRADAVGTWPVDLDTFWGVAGTVLVPIVLLLVRLAFSGD